MESGHDEVLAAIARAWCSPANSAKEMDSTLALAIVEEIRPMISRQEEIISGFIEPVRRYLKYIEETFVDGCPDCQNEFKHAKGCVILRWKDLLTSATKHMESK